jgi:hypothetical protein
MVSEATSALIARGDELARFLNSERHEHRLFVTLNCNTPATVGAMRGWLAVWYNSLNSKLYRNWAGRSSAERWRGWAFLEGHEAESAEEVTLHWHVLISPGPALSPDKYADMMTSRAHQSRSVGALHMIKQWQKICPKGTVDVQFINDLAGAVGYCTKDLRRMGPHLRRAHETYTPLPFV